VLQQDPASRILKFCKELEAKILANELGPVLHVLPIIEGRKPREIPLDSKGTRKKDAEVGSGG
jgi:hypothetical protein